MRFTVVRSMQLKPQAAVGPDKGGSGSDMRLKVIIMYFDHISVISTFSVCEMGRWQCTEDTCAQTCTAFDYGHFETFDGKQYNFQGGSCKYTLARVMIICQLYQQLFFS